MCHLYSHTLKCLSINWHYSFHFKLYFSGIWLWVQKAVKVLWTGAFSMKITDGNSNSWVVARSELKKQHAVLERFVSFVYHFCFELEPDWDDPLEPLRLSDECDRERLFLRPPEEDLERLLFWPLSGDDEGERDFFFGETEPFPDLELDLLMGKR